MHVEQVDFVQCRRVNFSRAVAFYRDVLGLPESEYSKGEIETPNVTIGFWSARGRRRAVSAEYRRGRAARGRRRGGGRGFCAAGGDVVGIEDTGVCHMAFVKDLDGNVLILHRRYAPKEKRGQG